jgi:hypothetical protein
VPYVGTFITLVAVFGRRNMLWSQLPGLNLKFIGLGK